MKLDYLKVWLKWIKFGFWKRIFICFWVVLSVSVFNSVGYPLVKLSAVISTLISAELMVYCYVPFYLSQISLLFRLKSTEQQLPDEIATLAKNMNVRINKIRVFPKVKNAFAKGNKVYVSEELLNELSLDEIRGVFAHEFQHVKDNWKHMLILYLYLLPILAFLSLMWQHLPSPMMNLGLFAYLTIFLIPIQWWFEKRADAAAAKYAGKEAIKSALLKLTDKNRMNEPSETHPPINKRLEWIDKA